VRIHLLSVGRRVPAWVDQGYREYAKRLPRECDLRLVEIESVRRRKGREAAGARREEGERMLAALPKAARVIALDECGTTWSTRELAAALAVWLADGRDLALLVGGADGLADACRARADQHWSLSPLTFPHPLVRILVAEQIYRAWSLLRGHPYHRG
jgi:23S rRNA (pseudouridine1915-N3)-methyltransferase